MTKETILPIKAKLENDAHIIGHQETGGLIEIDGTMRWLRHPEWRYNNGNWGRELFGFTIGDTSEVGCHLKVLPTKVSAELAQEHLKSLRLGELPQTCTKGIEVEGSMYDQHLSLTSVHDETTFRLEDNSHPELMQFTLETATPKNNGLHLMYPEEIAQALGNTVLKGILIAEAKMCQLTYTSVPEAGDYNEGIVTNHPYLQLAAPRVLADALQNQGNIPQQTLDLYHSLGINIINYLESTNNLNWPVQALHVHSGLPTHEGLVDPRIARVNAHLRQTPLVKAFNYMLYNTSSLYSQEMGLKDVRSIARWLLSTTHNGSLPHTAQELISNTISELETGTIHSPSRYPATGQHDRVRSRLELNYQTVESIDPPMCPDLRPIIAWSSLQSFLDIFALEAVVAANGDESKAIQYLQEQYGKTFSYQPSLGPNSSFEWDLTFNANGYHDPKISKAVQQGLTIIQELAERYPILQTQAHIINHVTLQAVSPVQNPNLEQRLGLDKGKYNPYLESTGIVTDHKVGYSLEELIEIQHQATKAQAINLTQIQDEKGLRAFFGFE